MTSSPVTQEWDTHDVVTVPNVISFIRLLGIPVFGWLIVIGNDLWAVALLVIFGATDWLDGYLARRLRQQSPLGAKLDPIADRLYILVTVAAMSVRGLVPWWLLLILLCRDVMLAVLLPFLRRIGRVSLPVTMVGKAGTMALLIAFPAILLGCQDVLDVPILWSIGWGCAVLGTVLYWVGGIQYLKTTIRLVRDSRRIADETS